MIIVSDRTPQIVSESEQTKKCQKPDVCEDVRHPAHGCLSTFSTFSTNVLRNYLPWVNNSWESVWLKSQALQQMDSYW